MPASFAMTPWEKSDAKLLRQARQYLADLEELRGLVARQPLRADRVREAQLRLKDIKEGFAADLKFASSARWETEMTRFAREYYIVMREVSGLIRVRSTSLPNGVWLNEVAGAAVGMSYFLHQFGNVAEFGTRSD